MFRALRFRWLPINFQPPNVPRPPSLPSVPFSAPIHIRVLLLKRDPNEVRREFRRKVPRSTLLEPELQNTPAEGRGGRRGALLPAAAQHQAPTAARDPRKLERVSRLPSALSKSVSSFQTCCFVLCGAASAVGRSIVARCRLLAWPRS